MKANLKVLENAASEQESFSRLMLNMSDELKDINRLLDSCLKPNYYNTNIKQCNDALIKSQRRITQCANALNNIVHLYSNTENRIVDNFDIRPGTGKPIEVGFQNIGVGKQMIDSIFK